MSDDNQTQFNIAAVQVVSGLVLTYKGENYTITPESTPFTMGRDDSCDVTINSSVASRQHCKILFHNKNYILKDNSTNGTFVRSGSSQPVKLSEGMTTLNANGKIKLGDTITVGDKDVISFNVNF